jgi:glycosyltransferase involved in cell wall biosynthesis
MVTPALFATSLAMGKAKIMRNKPAILVWVQDLYGLGISETGSAGGLVGRIVTGVEQRTLASASGVAVIHPRFAKHVTQNLGVDPNRLGIVRNWTHLQSLPVVDVPSVRSIHGWNAEETVVLHAGNMGVKQGLANVVAAARLADAQSLPLRFVLLGNGSQLQSLKSQATGIARIQFIETLPEGGFQEALAAADILLVNEKLGVSEMAVPSKLTSYFSTGRPVIAVSDMDGATAGEVLSAGAGLVVEPADPQLLLEAALLLSKNPKIAAGYGANGLRYRQLFLSDEAAILNFENFIRSVSERLSGEPDHK